MRKGESRFLNYMVKLEQLLQQAQKQKNPAIWLYKSNMRTPLFMLEALSKAYAGLHNKNKFTKLKERFKQLEDAIGAIDFYDAFATEFASSKTIPLNVSKYLKQHALQKAEAFNTILEEDGWLKGNKRSEKIKEKLSKAEWLSDAEEVKELEKFYLKQVENLNEFFAETKGKFDNLEDDVHELRRKLRWLSIYAQAFCGAIQLVETKPKQKHLDKYLIPEIVNSPFNKMPETGENLNFLLLSKSHFLALSWLISELGKLKDTGLKVLALKEALQFSNGLNEDKAMEQAYRVLGKKYPTINSILRNAEKLAQQFFKEKNLEKLLVGVAAAGKF